jgi:polysaccharide biosynthesis protein VpsQ
MKKIRIITLLFFLFICFVIFSADTSRMPSWMYLIYHFPNGDKVGHFGLYGIMAFLMNISFPNWKYRVGSFILPGGGLLFSVFSILEEISQSFFASRSSSLLDVACSLLGILVFSVLSNLVLKNPGRNETKAN